MEDVKQTPLGDLGSQLIDIPNHPTGFRFAVVDGGGDFAGLNLAEARALYAELKRLDEAGEL